MKITKDYRKKFSITDLREIAVKYDSYPNNPDNNLIGNNAIRSFLRWVEDNKTAIENKQAGK